MIGYWRAFKQFDRNVILFLIYFCAVAFSYFGVQGVLLNLYLLRLGFTSNFIGVMLGSGQLVWAAFALPAGIMGQRIGMKQAMTAGMVVMALSTVLMLGVETLPETVQPACLVLTWMLSWVGAALAAVNGPPYLMAVTNEQTRGFAFSAQQTVMAAAGFAGSLIGGFLPGIYASWSGDTLDSPTPFRAALILAPAAYLLGALAMSRAKPVVQSRNKSSLKFNNKIPVAVFLFLGLVIGFQALSEGTVRTFFNVYLDTQLNISTGMIGAIIGVSQLVLILISLVTPVLLGSLGVKRSLLFTTLGLSLFNTILAWMTTGFGAAFAYTGANGMLTMIATARSIYSQEVVSPRWRTTTAAIATIGMALGWAGGSWLAGAWVTRIGFQGLFLLGGGFALISFGVLALFLKKLGSPSEDSDEAPLDQLDSVPIAGDIGKSG